MEPILCLECTVIVAFDTTVVQLFISKYLSITSSTDDIAENDTSRSYILGEDMRNYACKQYKMNLEKNMLSKIIQTPKFT